MLVQFEGRVNRIFHGNAVVQEIRGEIFLVIKLDSEMNGGRTRFDSCHLSILPRLPLCMLQSNLTLFLHRWMNLRSTAFSAICQNSFFVITRCWACLWNFEISILTSRAQVEHRKLIRARFSELLSRETSEEFNWSLRGFTMKYFNKLLSQTFEYLLAIQVILDNFTHLITDNPFGYVSRFNKLFRFAKRS